MKKGDTFEVVEILDYGEYDKRRFKIGGWTIARKLDSLLGCLPNGKKTCNFPFPMYKHEARPVGRLIVTKVKNNDKRNR